VVGEDGWMVLSSLELEDSGNYSCVVVGSVGEAVAVAMLTVEDPLLASGVPSAPPTFISPTPSSQTLSVGQTVQFVCLVEGFPQPKVEWFRNGEPQPNLLRATILREVLTVESLRVTDVGLY